MNKQVKNELFKVTRAAKRDIYLPLWACFVQLVMFGNIELKWFNSFPFYAIEESKIC